MQAQRAPDWPFRQQAAQLLGGATGIDFCAAAPHDYVVAAGTRLHVYDGTTSAPKRQVTRFKDNAYSGSFRRDGRLLVAGGEDSVVQVRRDGRAAPAAPLPLLPGAPCLLWRSALKPSCNPCACCTTGV